jgi:hypothetical protein
MIKVDCQIEGHKKGCNCAIHVQESLNRCERFLASECEIICNTFASRIPEKEFNLIPEDRLVLDSIDVVIAHIIRVKNIIKESIDNKDGYVLIKNHKQKKNFLYEKSTDKDEMNGRVLH